MLSLHNLGRNVSITYGNLVIKMLDEVTDDLKKPGKPSHVVAVHQLIEKWERCDWSGVQQVLSTSYQPLSAIGKFNALKQLETKNLYHLFHVVFNHDHQVPSRGTFLQFVVENRDLQTLEKLLESEVDLLYAKASNETILHAAVKIGNEKVLNALLQYLVNKQSKLSNVADDRGISLLHILCASSESTYLAQFLDKVPNVDLNARVSAESDKWPGHAALHVAEACKRYDCATILVERGAKLEGKVAGTSILQSGNERMIEAVLKRKDVDVLAVVNELTMETALHVAAKRRDVESLDIFLDYVMAKPDPPPNVTDNDGLSLFHMLCMGKDSALVAKFLEQQKDCSTFDINRRVSIDSRFAPHHGGVHFAEAYRRHDTMKVLIERGAVDLSRTDVNGSTVLETRDKQMLEVMLKCEVDALVVNERNETAMHVAAKNHEMDIVCLFLDYVMARPQQLRNVADDDGLTLFHIVCMAPNLSHVVNFIKTLPETDVDQTTLSTSGFYPGFSALHFAFSYFTCRFDTAKFLIQCGASLTSRIAKGGLTALHLACKRIQVKAILLDFLESHGKYEMDRCKRYFEEYLNKRYELIHMVLERCGDVDVRDDMGNNALSYLVRNSYPETDVSFACQHDSACIYVNGLLRCEEFQSAFNVHQDLVVSLFLDQTDPGRDTWSALRRLASAPSSSANVLRQLLEGGDVDLNAVDERGRTLLHIAAENNNCDFIRGLLDLEQTCLEKRVNVNARDKDGRTAFNLLQMEGGYEFCECVYLLLEQGADICIKPESERSSLPLLYRAISGMMSQRDFREIRQLHLDRHECEQAREMYDRLSRERGVHMDLVEALWKHVESWRRLSAQSERALLCRNDFQIKLTTDLHVEHKKAAESIVHLFSCGREVKAMRKFKLDLVEFLLCRDPRQLAIHAENEDLRQLMASGQVDEQFSCYARALRARFVEGLHARK